VKRASRGLCAWFSVCQAMSIAMTTVLPEPVAIFNAVRGRPELCTAFASSRRRRQSVPDHRPSPGDLGQEDRRLGSLILADGIARVGAG